MGSFEKVSKWISEDSFRVSCINATSSLISDEWFISAGFVRNLVWDKMHGYENNTPLNDIDIIYFNSSHISLSYDVEIENALKNIMPMCKWSVKNQARMSIKHGHIPYQGCIEAMSYWPEIQTAIGVTKLPDEKLTVASPFNPNKVVQLAVTRNPKCTSIDFYERMKKKGWEKLWPELRIEI